MNVKYKPADTAKFFYDRFGIMVCECPKCENFIPVVAVGEIIKCPKCMYEFKVVE